MKMKAGGSQSVAPNPHFLVPALASCLHVEKVT
jgi:hypothetical protein